ncbi:hypothetical protein ACTWQF_24350 [Streptomyces sp. 8N114]|uniref:hypothetical protein n=1 Tax=Streptomyces sp. 8N114 TaxID=3457419 RepID=UPI003FD0B435
MLPPHRGLRRPHAAPQYAGQAERRRHPYGGREMRQAELKLLRLLADVLTFLAINAGLRPCPAAAEPRLPGQKSRHGAQHRA